MHGGEREQRMLDVVAGENGERPIGRQIALQERRRDRINRGQRVRISHRAPAACGIALRQENALAAPLWPNASAAR